jgi:hypothetical protein
MIRRLRSEPELQVHARLAFLVLLMLAVELPLLAMEHYWGSVPTYVHAIAILAAVGLMMSALFLIVELLVIGLQVLLLQAQNLRELWTARAVAGQNTAGDDQEPHKQVAQSVPTLEEDEDAVSGKVLEERRPPP